MAEFVEIMKIKKRMCDVYRTSVSCGKCPLKRENNRGDASCAGLCKEHPEEAEEIILKWAAEHPQKTRLTDFLEKYPNAKIGKNGTPYACAGNLGYCKTCQIELSDKCEDCWNTPL